MGLNWMLLERALGHVDKEWLQPVNRGERPKPYLSASFLSGRDLGTTVNGFLAERLPRLRCFLRPVREVAESLHFEKMPRRAPVIQPSGL